MKNRYLARISFPGIGQMTYSDQLALRSGERSVTYCLMAVRNRHETQEGAMKTSEEPSKQDTGWCWYLPLTEPFSAWITHLRESFDWRSFEVDDETGFVFVSNDDLIAYVDMTRNDDLLKAAFGLGRRKLLRKLGAKEVRRPR